MKHKDGLDIAALLLLLLVAIAAMVVPVALTQPALLAVPAVLVLIALCVVLYQRRRLRAFLARQLCSTDFENSRIQYSLANLPIPTVLVNANTGIAVGMASSICPFNLKEVCETTIGLIRDPDFDVMSTLLAPDFPTGGQLVCDPAELAEIYRTGRGGVKVRARWRYDKKENLIEIFEIPYSTSIEVILDKVAELVKAGKVKEISDMRDESDLSGLKLTIDLKRGVDPEKLMQKLYKLTPLQDTFSCNFNILIAGMPRVMGVREILDEWTGWRMEGVRRRTYFVMKKKQDKLHLLRGLKKILLDIDRAIKIIRETDS